MALSCLTYEIGRPPRWNTFVAGLIVNLVGIALLIVWGPHLTNWEPTQKPINYRPITLVAPRIVPVPDSLPPPRQRAKLQQPAINIAPQPETPIPPKQVARDQTHAPTSQSPRPLSSVPSPMPAPLKVVKTDTFDGDQSEVATVRATPRKVQTGGFGDPNGLPGQGNPQRNTIAAVHVGSFGLPSGQGKGDGSGAGQGIAGTIRSSGFGSGIASSVPHERGYGGGIADSGFGTPVSANLDSTRQQAAKKPQLDPVQILYKPHPDYTAEARSQRVEGEVLLDVVFTATGSLRVNRIVRGLGYGLDEMALAAAQRIRFRPARRNGQPYDCAALVHMVFQLAK